MPDLRTELMKLENLKFDDDVQSTDEVVPTENTSMMAQIWRYVKDHPGCTYVDIIKALGHSQSDVSTRLTQMYNAGKLTRNTSGDRYAWFTVSDKYERKEPKPYKKRKPKSVAKAVKPAVPAAAPKLPTKYDVNDLLSTMSIIEARAMYDRLKELFGG